MNARKLSAWIFLIVGLLHFYRAAVRGNLEYLHYDVPVWASWAVAAACGCLAFLNFRGGRG